MRESGSIEQDADLVGLLVRPEIYEDDEDARAEKAGEAELIIAKQRNGPVGEIALTFLKEFTRFEDRARNVTEPLIRGSSRTRGVVQAERPLGNRACIDSGDFIELNASLGQPKTSA